MTQLSSILIICRFIMSEQIFSEDEIEELREVIRMIQLNLVLNKPVMDISKDKIVNETMTKLNEDTREIETLSAKLEIADDKNRRLMEMYSAKVSEVSELEERLRISEVEREAVKDKLRTVELEVRFSRQCHGENALLNSLMSRLDIRPGQGLLGPGPPVASRFLPQETQPPPFVPRSVMKNSKMTKL